MPLDLMMSWLMAPSTAHIPLLVLHVLPLKLILVLLVLMVLLDRILARIITIISVDWTRVAVKALEVFKTHLDGLHLFQKLFEGGRVQSGLKVDPLGNISELGQV